MLPIVLFVAIERAVSYTNESLNTFLEGRIVWWLAQPPVTPAARVQYLANIRKRQACYISY